MQAYMTYVIYLFAYIHLNFTLTYFQFVSTEYIRPGGCKKGLFTRERQPKMAAHITRWRYWTLAHNSVNVTVPNDLLFAGP